MTTPACTPQGTITGGVTPFGQLYCTTHGTCVKSRIAGNPCEVALSVNLSKLNPGTGNYDPCDHAPLYANGNWCQSRSVPCGNAWVFGLYIDSFALVFGPGEYKLLANLGAAPCGDNDSSLESFEYDFTC